MVTSTKDNVVFNRGVLTFGTAGSTATTTVGFIASGEAIAVAIEPEMGEARAEGKELPIIKKRTSRTITVSGRFMQHETDLMKLVFGAAAVGNTITLSGDVADTPTFSLKITATAEDGGVITYTFPYCVSISAPSIEYVSTEVAQVDFQFEVIEGAVAATVINGYTSAVTLATGALARTAGQGYNTITSEDGLADDLTSITGTLVDGETLMLQITSEAAPITLVHSVENLNLTGNVDWEMDKLGDWILLTYTDSGTVWTESGRYDAP